LALTFLQVKLLRLRFLEHADLLIEEDRQQCLLHDEFALKWRYIPRGRKIDVHELREHLEFNEDSKETVETVYQSGNHKEILEDQSKTLQALQQVAWHKVALVYIIGLLVVYYICLCTYGHHMDKH
jgi:hypothetical protein